MISTLLPHQVVARDWCLEREETGCILADDMGLGKTVTTCAVLVAKPVKTLIVAPLALLEQWKTEIAKHTTGLSAAIYRGNTGFSMPDTVITITNPETVLGDSKKGRLRAYEAYERVVIDEAHVIRNAKSKLYEAFKKAIGTTQRKLFLTGTPICNKSTDLIALVTLLNIPIYSKADYWAGKDVRTVVESLQHVRTNYVLRRTKEEILSDRLPNKEIKTVEMPLSSELYATEYNRIRSRYVKPVITKILRLRQCVSQISLVHKSLVNEFGSDPSITTEMSAKLEYIRTTLAAVPSGEKVVIFSQWTTMLDSIASYVSDIAGEPLIYHGKLGAAEKTEVLERFREDPDKRVLLVSLKSGGCGLNLCMANHVILTEPYYNAAEEKQAIDRVYRIGQTRDVFVHRLYVPNTVESWMYQLQSMKNTITDSVLTADADTAKSADNIVAEKITKNTMFQELVQAKK